MNHDHSDLANSHFYCVVDGGWSKWEHGPCTKTCGGGTMSMIRQCNNPEPSCGGNVCVGSSIVLLEASCSDLCCPGKKIRIILDFTVWLYKAIYSYMANPSSRSYSYKVRTEEEILC